MAGEVGPDVGPAADDAQEPGLDERRECALVDRHQRILCRVHLEQSRAVVGEQLVEHVEHRDRRHVPRSEHEAHTARLGGRALREAGRCARGAGGDPRFQPDLAREARQQEPVDAGEGEGVHAGASSGRAIDRDPVERVHTVRQAREGLDIGVERAEHAVRSAEPLFTAQGMPRVEALRGGGRVRPVLRGGGDARAHRAQQRRPLGDGEGRPGARSGLKGIDRGVEPFSFPFAQLRGCASRRALRGRGGGGGCARRSHRRLLRTGSQLRCGRARGYRCPLGAGGSGGGSADSRPSARRAAR